MTSELSWVGNDLMKSIKYDPKNGYHPLEKYVRIIDHNLDDSNTLKVIGERIGIFIPESENTQEGMYIKLKDFLEREEDLYKSEKIIDMSPNQYEKYLVSLDPSNKNLPRQSFYPIYADRLYLSLSQK